MQAGGWPHEATARRQPRRNQPSPEHILGTDILQGQWLQTTAGEFSLKIGVVRAVLRAPAQSVLISAFWAPEP